MVDNVDNIRIALKSAVPRLHACANVVASGIGYKVTNDATTPDLSIVCSVTRKIQTAQLDPKDVVPNEIDGIPTDVVETGKIRALQSHTARHRPAPGGISIGHRDITAGTLGCLVKKGDQTVILSNNHVIANSNDAQQGDAILQPGPIDGGRFPVDHIADLEDFVRIEFLQPEPPSDCPTASTVIAMLNWICKAIGSRTRYRTISLQASDNLVDAAIARPLRDTDVVDDILRIGSIQGFGDVDLGAAIKKSGRTTEFTTGQILQVNVTVDVDYGAGRTARFVDQLLAGPMSQGGDSGSAILDDDNNLVGLLFAGSDNTTIMNRISHVFNSLGVTR